MSYNIFGSTAPPMPRPAKGTEIVKLLLSQASRDMSEPLVPMAIPALASHLTDVELMYSDNQYYELCGQMGHLVGPSGIGKAQLTRLIEAIMVWFWNVRRMMERHDIDKLRSLSCESVAQRLDVSCSRDVCKPQTEGLQVGKKKKKDYQLRIVLLFLFFHFELQLQSFRMNN